MADVFHYLENKPVEERCKILTDYFKEALHQKTPITTLQEQLPGIFEDIFVSCSTRKSWMFETDEGVVKTVLNLLKPEGLIFQAAIKFMLHPQLSLRFPTSYLPAVVQASIKDKRFDDLPPLFKNRIQIPADGSCNVLLNTFECFMFYFALSAVVPLPWSSSLEKKDCHNLLLNSYLEYFYPLPSLGVTKKKPWKLGNYENEALTRTFIDIITQFWLNQNSKALGDKGQFRIPTLLQLKSVSTLLSYTLVSAFRPRPLHSTSTGTPSFYDSDSAAYEFQAMIGIFDAQILPVLYQFLKAMLSGGDSSITQPDQLNYLPKVIELWSMVIQPWAHYKVSQPKKHKDRPFSLVPAQITQVTQFLSGLVATTSKATSVPENVGIPETPQDIKAYYESREFRGQVIKGYVMRDVHIVLYTTLVRLLLNRAKKVSLAGKEEQKSLYQILTPILNVKEFVTTIDSIMETLSHPQTHMNPQFAQGQYTIRNQANAIQQTIQKIDGAPYESIFTYTDAEDAKYIAGKIKAHNIPKLSSSLLKVICNLYQLAEKDIAVVESQSDSRTSGIGLYMANAQKNNNEKREKLVIYNKDGSLSEEGRAMLVRGYAKCNREDAKYLGDPRFQPVRSTENEFAVKSLMALSRLVESWTGQYYDLRFLGSYPAWVALFVVFFLFGVIYILAQVLAGSTVPDRNSRYQNVLKWNQEHAQEI
eukprot:TRINITY_DN6913_c0_g1_i1.p1 TRINITY_DN6913_c0_g1~~TRINITY_DN6913_c0_g1_i1.p1  ORF type:complete len:702 (+),score=109.93 TRINITY_DN6913_c0_g1_i1:343-2448(+)